MLNSATPHTTPLPSRDFSPGPFVSVTSVRSPEDGLEAQGVSSERGSGGSYPTVSGRAAPLPGTRGSPEEIVTPPRSVSLVKTPGAEVGVGVWVSSSVDLFVPTGPHPGPTAWVNRSFMGLNTSRNPAFPDPE